MNRDKQLQQIKNTEHWDLLVIGGGATGLGVALDAVSRGLQVCLLEKYDFGKGTSSRSTKLVHGGVRYLEQGNVSLVKEALQEREYILSHATHLSRVQPFVVPCYSWWSYIYYYVGLRVYDILAGRKSIGRTQLLKASTVIEKIPNIKSKGLRGGVQYMDGQFDDTRLCIDLVKTIIKHGGTCVNHVGATGFIKEHGRTVGCQATDHINGDTYTIMADHVVNAAGIFTDDIVQMDAAGSRRTIVPSRGSHIVLDRSYLGGNEAIMIPKTTDGRVLFIIPWNDKVVVGTTDEKTDQPVAEPKATDAEINFILNNCAQYLSMKPTRADILSTYAGLRPLAAPKEGSQKTKEISRGHKVIISASGLVSIIGGKWTTFRKMGQDALDKINRTYKKSYPASTSLGITIAGKGVYSTTDRLHPSLPYSEADIAHVIRNEMPMTLEDVLCRRTRCVLLDTAATKAIMHEAADMLQEHLQQSDQWKTEQVEQLSELLFNYEVTPST